jgi:ATP synthase (E/31 kDa) subunit
LKICCIYSEVVFSLYMGYICIQILKIAYDVVLFSVQGLLLIFSLNQEFNIEKLQLFEGEKKKLRQEYEKKEKQVEIRKKM